MRDRDPSSSASKNFYEWLRATILFTAIKAAVVPPTQPLFVYMTFRQTNINAAIPEVWNFAYKRGLLAGTSQSVIREVLKTPSKALGLQLGESTVNQITQRFSSAEQEKTVGIKITKNAAKGAVSGTCEGIWSTVLNAWRTWSITSSRGASYWDFLRQDSSNHFDMLKKASRGLGLTTAKQGGMNAVLFGSVDFTNSYVCPLFSSYSATVQKLAGSTVSAMMVAALFAPTETILTNIQKSGAKGQGALDITKFIYNQHGFKGLCAGVIPKFTLILIGSTLNAGFVNLISGNSSSQAGHRR